MGVFSPDLTEMVAEVLGNLGVRHAFVVHGSDGLDEITLTGQTKVTELKDGRINEWQFDPKEFGFTYCKAEDLKGGDAAQNAEITQSILSGEKGPRRDVVVINSAAAILASGLASDFKEAIAKAKESIDSGAAKKCLEKLVKYSKSL